MKKLITFLCAVVIVSPVHAYLDPGSGSIVVQVIVGAIAGSLVTIKMFWVKIKSFFTNNKK